MTPVKIVKTREYYVNLDNGVRLTFSLPENVNGPSIQPAFMGDDALPYRVRLPGGIVSIYAPSVTVGGINWADVADRIGVEFDFPRIEPPPPPPKRDPYIQKVIE